MSQQLEPLGLPSWPSGGRPLTDLHPDIKPYEASQAATSGFACDLNCKSSVNILRNPG